MNSTPEKKKRMKQNIIYVLFIVAAILSYDFFQVIAWGSCEYFSLVVTDGLSEMGLGYFFVDTFACFLMLFLYIPWVYSVNRKERHGKVTASNFLEVAVITLGVGGITNIWFFIVENYLAHIQTFSESLVSFEMAFSNEAGEPFIWEFLSVAVLGAVVEELIFRGLVYNYLERINGAWFAVIVSGIIFGLWHGEPVQIVYTAIMGIGIAIIYKKTRSLSLTIFFHILNNGLSVIEDSLNIEILFQAQNIISMAMILPMLYLLYRYAEIKWRNREISSIIQNKAKENPDDFSD